MRQDEVVKEVRAAREAYGALFDFDLTAIVADLRRQNEQGDRPVVWRAPRRPDGYMPVQGATANPIVPARK